MKKVVIDCGHGQNTPGKRIPSANYVSMKYRDIREWTLNSCVGHKLIQKLAPYDLQIVRTDDISGKTDVPIAARRKMADNADMFISIHHNAGLSGKRGGGVVVYYHTDRPYMKNYAYHLYSAVIMRCENMGNRATPITHKRLAVINKENKASVALLIECGFMDGPDDIAKITDPQYGDAVAQGIAEFILSILQPGVKR